MILHTCKSCKNQLPIDHFLKNKSMATGYENECKFCRRRRHAECYKRDKAKRPDYYKEKSRLCAQRMRQKRTIEEKAEYASKFNVVSSRNRWAQRHAVLLLNRCESLLEPGNECIIVLIDNPVPMHMPINPERPWVGKTFVINWMSKSKLPRPDGIPMCRIYKHENGKLDVYEMLTTPDHWKFVANRFEFVIRNKEKNDWPEFRTRA